MSAATGTVPDVREPPADPPPGRWRRWAGGALLLLLVAGGGAVLAARLGGDQPAPSALVGHPAPALTGQTLDGHAFDLTDLRGSVVLVNVWASWCVPCQREMPLLATAAEQLGPRGLQLVGIDVRDDPADAGAFLAAHQATGWPAVADPDGTRAVDWGTFALPETYLLDRDGTVVAKAVGEVTEDWLRQNVLPLLDEEAP